jgi:DNA-binding NarL/FixJ family response regulator
MLDPGPILVLSGDPVLRGELVQTLARSHVHDVVVSTSAVEAYRRLDDCRPRVALVDWNLKTTGGLGAAAQLIARSGELGFRLSVVFIAPFEGEGMMLAAQGLGASAVIGWPQHWQALAPVIVEFGSNPGNRRPVGA